MDVKRRGMAQQLRRAISNCCLAADAIQPLRMRVLISFQAQRLVAEIDWAVGVLVEPLAGRLGRVMGYVSWQIRKQEFQQCLGVPPFSGAGSIAGLRSFAAS